MRTVDAGGLTPSDDGSHLSWGSTPQLILKCGWQSCQLGRKILMLRAKTEILQHAVRQHMYNHQ